MARISEQRKVEIASMFQASLKRDNSTEIALLSLTELRDTDEMLGDRDVNAGYRLALRNRIKDLETNDARRRESYIRAWNLVVGIFAGILIAVIGTWLTRL